MTMASLLHRDADGRALVTALVEASGVDPVSWLRSYLHAYVRPIVHCLLAHDLAFMPHGENLVLVLHDRVPVRTLMKDVGEEVAVMSTTRPLPEEVERIRVDVDQDIKSLSLHTDVFDGVLRHLAAILDEDGVVDGETFWDEVRRCVHQHADEHPELADAAATYDLFRAGVPAQLPQPAAAAQHPGDGGHRRSGGVADLRRDPGQPDRRAGAGAGGFIAGGRTG